MKFFLLVGVALLLKGEVDAQPINTSVSNCEKLQPALEPFIQGGLLQGKVLVAKGSTVLCQRSIGFADIHKKQAINPSSRFPIASLSKPIVASLILKLQEEGVLNTDDTLAKYLPEFEAEWATQVTLHHLLANRSGIANHFMLPGWGTDRFDSSLPNQVLMSDIANMQLAFTPGTQYLYSNLGWYLLAQVVEQVSGKTLEENLKAHIFAPAKMTETGIIGAAEKPLVSGLRWHGQGGWKLQHKLNIQVFYGGAGLYSTATDLLKYINALHDGGVLSKQSQKQQFSPDSPYGWRIETYSLSNDNTQQVRTFDGQLLGHSGFVYYLVEDKVSIILLTNTGMGFEHKRALADDLLNALYGLPFPNRTKAPSLLLNQSLLDNNWQADYARLQTQSIDDLETAFLINDLAQQLDWSGNTAASIDLYHWLMKSFPENPGIRQQLERLCVTQENHALCESN